MAIGYKLFKLRKDGSIGPLFINAASRTPIGEWLPAEDHPTKGFAHRPGWHLGLEPKAPHLAMSPKRGWFKCEYDAATAYEFKRPSRQGGKWIIAQAIKVIGPV